VAVETLDESYRSYASNHWRQYLDAVAASNDLAFTDGSPTRVIMDRRFRPSMR
jgi:hypothetical protein